ncbi:hypothetical protein GMO_26000 [Gluconobacter morbifer G707]|uniref:Uncharacterized protein n=1 Tax=Gluconobacter morbifer G707 TaxID=1088869 RepID=G6XM82_9PROT|nr:hypothetical protein GMO_26000 [Gluconobacter morbifer G707]
MIAPITLGYSSLSYDPFLKIHLSVSVYFSVHAQRDHSP